MGTKHKAVSSPRIFRMLRLSLLFLTVFLVSGQWNTNQRPDSNNNGNGGFNDGNNWNSGGNGRPDSGGGFNNNGNGGFNDGNSWNSGRESRPDSSSDNNQGGFN